MFNELKRGEIEITSQIGKLSCLTEKIHTVKPEYNDHHRDLQIVAVVYRWSLFRGSFGNVENGTSK
jgi:hypothetical protein